MNQGEHQIRRPGPRRGAWLGRFFIATAALLIGSGNPLAQTVEVRRVLALRVSFPQESPDDETTSGDGTFDLRTFEEASADFRFPFDTPPHNRSYFQAHMQALAHYFGTVSGGRLQIEYDVLPAGENDSYVLEKPLIEYGNGRTRQEINQRIVELFRDGILAADAQEGAALDFPDYTDVIVIHAGLGGESSNELNDITSAFIDLDDLNTYIQGPIVVDGGGRSIESGMLVPEAGGRDGRAGLNGILARFYANQLGLPRLDNPEDGLPAIGDWSLMDTGNIAFGSSARLGLSNLSGDPSDTLLVGYIPSLLTAWSRARLGWLEPVEVRQDTTLSVASSHSASTAPRAVRVPITADEYFLIENRMSRLAIEGRRPTITFSNGTSGVWTSNDDYDAFIPGSGILIWHVDDAVVRGSVDGKAVNSNIDFRTHFDGLVGLYRKGIALEEADGLEDIGNTSASRVITSGIISFSDISGGPLDPYYVGNLTRIGPDTTPSTANNLGYASGIEIEVLSAPGEVMDIAIRFTQQQDDWPRRQTNALTGIAPKAGSIEGVMTILNAEGSAWTLTGSERPLAGYEATRTPALGPVDGSPGLDILFTDGISAAMWSDGRSAPADIAAPSTMPLIAPFPEIGSTDVWGHADGSVRWGVFGGPSGEARIGLSAIVGLSFGDVDGNGGNELIALDASGQISSIDVTGTVSNLGAVDEPVGAILVRNLDESGGDEAIALSRDGSVSIFGQDQDPTVSRPVNGGAGSSHILTDLDGDGRQEILFGGDSRVWVVRYNGIPQSDTPIPLPLKDNVGLIQAPPVTGDFDGDGTTDLIIATGTGAIYALNASGTALPGFPILAAGAVSTSPLISDLDGDGLLELVAFTESGSAHLWHLDRLDPSLTGNTVYWGESGSDASNGNKSRSVGAITPPPETTELLPASKSYCYPNPIRGQEAFVRFYLSEEADVELIVLDAVGRIVDRIAATRTDADTDNEIRWDTSDYGSGIYICRLEATNGSRSQTQFIKTAIIR